MRGLTKVQDCLLGAGGSPDLRPNDAPGNAQPLNGTSAPRPDSPRAQLRKTLSKATRLYKNDSESETQQWAGAVGKLQ